MQTGFFLLRVSLYDLLLLSYVHTTYIHIIDASGYIYNWHLSTQKCLSTIHEDRHTLAAKFAPDYLTFATAGSDNKVYIYDQSTRAIQAILEPR